MSKYTPGPWIFRPSEVNDITGAPYYHYIDDSEGNSIASTWAGPHIPNARLLACAPELLEQLSQAWACIEHLRKHAPKDMDDAIAGTLKDIEQVIFKATGGGLR